MRCACICNNGVWILFPLVIRRAIDDLNKQLNAHKLLLYAGALLAVAGTKAIFQFLTRWILIGVSREIEFDHAQRPVRAFGAAFV